MEVYKLQAVLIYVQILSIHVSYSKKKKMLLCLFSLSSLPLIVLL